MRLIESLNHKALWAKGEITLTEEQAHQIIDILEAAREYCGAKADEVTESEDETLLDLFEALRNAGEEFGD